MWFLERFSPTERTRTVDKNPVLPVYPPPREPRPTTWRCHKCHNTYRLAVTRRCLVDGHVFCNPSKLHTPSTIRSWSQWADPSRASSIVCDMRQRQCVLIVDYCGWKDWAVWKQEMSRMRDSDNNRRARSSRLRKQRAGVRAEEGYYQPVRMPPNALQKKTSRYR